MPDVTPEIRVDSPGQEQPSAAAPTEPTWREYLLLLLIFLATVLLTPLLTRYMEWPSILVLFQVLGGGAGLLVVFSGILELRDHLVASGRKGPAGEEPVVPSLSPIRKWGRGLLILARALLAGAFLGCFLFAQLSCGAFVANGIFGPLPVKAFEPEAWKRKNPNLRPNMLKDLLDSKRLIGLSPDQAIGLLGPPDSRNETGTRLTWFVGMEFLAATNLIVSFENGKASEAAAQTFD